MAQSAITFRLNIRVSLFSQMMWSKCFLCGFIFSGAPKIISHVLIFVESPKMRKIAKFYSRKNLMP